MIDKPKEGQVGIWHISNIKINLFFTKNTGKANRLSSYMAIPLLPKCQNLSCRCMKKISDVF